MLMYEYERPLGPMGSSNGNAYLSILTTFLCVSEHQCKVMKTIKSFYRLKEDASGKTCGPPERYLEANIGKTILEDGNDYWNTSLDDYMKEAVKSAKNELKNSGKVLKKNVEGPMASGYQTEFDVSL